MHRNYGTRFIYILSLLTLACSSSDKREKDPPPPNVIYILADDLGYGDLGCYGQQLFDTPHIDRLASGGMRFTSHYAGSTVCAPSRAVLMTGLHTGHNTIRGNGRFPLPDSCYTIAELFRDAGYATGAFGKWGLGFPADEGYTGNQGFDVFYGYYHQGIAHRYYPPSLWRNKEEIKLDNDSALKDFSADLIHNEALGFIREHRDRPFYLYLPYTIPHAELIVPEDSLLEKNRGKYLPEKEYEGDPYFVEDYKPYGYVSQPESHAVFVAMVQRLDLHVGQIMTLLDELGIAGNTIVMFSSDNGPHEEGGADPDYFRSNGPLTGIKRDLYEGGIRVPFIVRWPGVVEPGSETDHVSWFADMLPTFSELTEVPLPYPVDGLSMLPLLKGKGVQPEHEYLYWEFHERKGKQAIRDGKWKAVKLNVDSGPDTPIELYNLSADISESDNVADVHPEVVERMRGIFKKARTPSDLFRFDYEEKK